MKKNYLLIALLSILVSTNLLAEGKYTLTGGINFSTINYNEDELNDNLKIQSKTNFMLGIESPTNPIRIGVVFVQKGASLDNYHGSEKYEQTFNYIALYALLALDFYKRIIPFGALECGMSLGGKEKWTDYDGSTNTRNIAPHKINFELGLNVGTDIMLLPKIGVRGSYCIGLTNVVKDLDKDLNFKNRTFEFNLLFKL